ncbi:hypothetical protein HDU67_000091 [Dinochytrium kinnereticum]|nr:hypothetical protein HDU67_000091 [Dinochytrium kinnereticum]
MEQDVALLAKEGVDVVFAPTVKEMYPAGIVLDVSQQQGTFVEVKGMSHQMFESLTIGHTKIFIREGMIRPHFFRGVATVVTKLFNIIQPTKAYFGQKDGQQCAVVRSMVRDLFMPIEVVICETIREKDGLAMSSRNRYLSEKDRAAAPILYKALWAASQKYLTGERNVDVLVQTAKAVIATEPYVQLEYVSIANPFNLAEENEVGPDGGLMCGAVKVGSTRIIDNVLLGFQVAQLAHSTARFRRALVVIAVGITAQLCCATKEEPPNYCSPNGAIQDTFCEFETVDKVNSNVFTLISNLVTTSFFKYYKVDLKKECPFWEDDRFCVQKDCAVQEVTDESEIPAEWNTASLSHVDFSTVDQGFGIFQKKCEFSDKDFCVVEDETSTDGVYVDLLKNPERFTGYAGDSAARVWRAVYTENCFESDENPSTFPGDTTECMEKRVFYRLISGLHSSISTHICDKHLNRKTGEWYPDLGCFLSRVGRFPDRIENLYFTYVVLLRAIAKLAPYLQSYKWCTGNMSDKMKIESLISQIVELSLSCPDTFDEKLMFADSTSKALKEEFKTHFRNISRIMDCVGCEKCRLWGKLQVSGLGTALKILFSFGDNPKEFKLSRSELVALINGFSRLSDSIEAMNRFRQQISFAEGSTRQTEVKADAVKVADSELHAKEFLTKSSFLDLSHTSFADPRFLFSWGVGFVIFALGLARIIQKGYQLENGTLELPEGIESNIRADGRGRLDCRSSTFEVGLITQASGSCQLQTDNGTHVLVGIKVDIGSIEPSQNIESNEGDDESDSLSISKDKGKVICTILEFGGNAFDCIFLATRGALNDTLYPKATIEESAGHYEFEVSDEETLLLAGLENVPVTVTILGSNAVLGWFKMHLGSDFVGRNLLCCKSHVGNDLAHVRQTLETAEEVIEAKLLPGDFAIPMDQKKLEADGGPESESESDSDIEFSDEEPGSIPHTKGAKAENADDSDEEGCISSTGTRGLRTKNELDVLPPVNVVDVQIPPDAEIKEMGTIMAHVDNQIIILSATDGEKQVLGEDTVIFTQDRSIVGPIFEIFGPVLQPLYSVRFNSSSDIDPVKHKIGERLFYAPTLAKFVFTAQVKAIKGSDASNIYDEEVPENELGEDRPTGPEADSILSSQRMRREPASRSAHLNHLDGAQGITGIQADDLEV